MEKLEMTGTRYDLHMHSYYSDGVLAPAALMQRAYDNGVNVAALTDHDTVEGVVEALEQARQFSSFSCIPGVEISVVWAGSIIHVLGLSINPTHTSLLSALAETRRFRAVRGQEIAKKIEEFTGKTHVWESVCAYAPHPNAVARTHFARFLIDQGVVRDTAAAFHQYLKEGKKAFVPITFITLEQAVAAILNAGGWPVLAHPGRYQSLSMLQLDVLFEQFKMLGGVGIEVYTGSHAPYQYPIFLKKAQHYGFYVSVGSDFHAPHEGRLDIGELPLLPTGVKGVWTLWQ